MLIFSNFTLPFSPFPNIVTMKRVQIVKYHKASSEELPAIPNLTSKPRKAIQPLLDSDSSEEQLVIKPKKRKQSKSNTSTPLKSKVRNKQNSAVPDCCPPFSDDLIDIPSVNFYLLTVVSEIAGNSYEI